MNFNFNFRSFKSFVKFKEIFVKKLTVSAFDGFLSSTENLFPCTFDRSFFVFFFKIILSDFNFTFPYKKNLGCNIENLKKLKFQAGLRQIQGEILLFGTAIRILY